jgi:hypothetical protein
MSSNPEAELNWYAESGSASTCQEILNKFPNLNINWRSDRRANLTALHQACRCGHLKVVELLLAHPKIDVNAFTWKNNTPLSEACHHGYWQVVQVLLKNPNVLLDLKNTEGRTAISLAVEYGSMVIVDLFIISGREFSLGETFEEREKLREVSKNKHGMLELIEAFKENPEGKRHYIRCLLHWYHYKAAEYFALVVFFCDGLLQFGKTEEKKKKKTVRFLRIVGELPMELQMIVCFRLVGSAHKNLASKYTEEKFKELARVLEE